MRPPDALRQYLAMVAAELRLRPFEEIDLDLLDRFAGDPSFSAPFEWSGYRSAASFHQRWAEDGFLDKDPHFLVVAEESALGWVMWERPYRGAGRSDVWVIGILLAPEHPGRGVGTSAQQLLVYHLFDTTSAHRICAFTEVENLAEQKALEKCGFRREGVLRQSGFVRGDWRHDLRNPARRTAHAIIRVPQQRRKWDRRHASPDPETGGHIRSSYIDT